MKLEKLTKEQEEKIPEIRNFWLNYILSCKNSLDREKAKEGIEWLYKYCGKEKPVIIFMDSPLGCQVAANFFLKYFEKSPDNIWANIRANIGANIGANIRDNIWANIRANIGANIRANIGANILKYHEVSWAGTIGNYGWVAYLDYFLQLQLIHSDREKDFNSFKELLLSGVYEMIQFDGLCIVSDLPTKIVRNNSGRLHNHIGSAVEFKDGYAQHYINGRYISPEIFLKTKEEKITKKYFLQEKNSDIKGAIYEIYGQKKMLELLGAKEVDTQTIAHKNGDLETVTLLKTNETFTEIDNNPFAWVKMSCPSTGTQYLQGVEPHHTNALEAIASLSPFKTEEYSFDMRS